MIGDEDWEAEYFVNDLDNAGENTQFGAGNSLICLSSSPDIIASPFSFLLFLVIFLAMYKS